MSFLICWALNAYSEIGRFFREGTLFARVLQGHTYVADFVLYYLSARLACLGSQANIYDPVVQENGIKAILAPIVPELNFYMQYPPHYFVLCMPLAAFSLGTAYIVWVCWWLSLQFIGLWFLIKASFPSRFNQVFAWASIYGSYPAWLMVELGQTVLFQFASTLGFFLLMRSKKYFAAGLISIILMIKLQYMPIFLLVGLVVGKWRYAAGLLISSLVVGIATYVVVGANNILAYPQALIFGETSDKVSGVSVNMMQNFRGEFVLLAGGENRVLHLAVLALFGLSLLVTGYIWLRLYPRMIKAFDEFSAYNYASALTILIMLCASPHTHMQDFILASISLVCIFPLCQSANALTRRQKAMKTLLIGAPFFSWIFFIFSVGIPIFFLLRLQPFFIWDLCMIALVAFELRDRLSKPVPVAESHPSS